MSAVGQANAFLGNVAKLGFVAVLGVAGWFGYRLTQGDADHARELAARDADLTRVRDDLAARAREVTELTAEVAAKQREIDRIALALKLQKVERRVARLVVIDRAEVGGKLTTRVRFEEVDGAGDPLGAAQEITIDGDVVYVDAWVVKFEDLCVEQGDPLRAASLVLFRRLFGEHQAPSQGTLIDRQGARPAAYGGDAPMTAVEEEVWQDFWALANDPARAAKLGVRAAHGEAPSMKLVKGEVYKVTLRASGGLTIAPDRPEPTSR